MPHTLTTGPRNRGKANTGSSGDWTLESTTRYVYDGMRVIQERSSANTPTVSCTWGTDLSGSLEGAGGIGGLLGRSHAYATYNGTWATHSFYHADGNGNVTYLLSSSQTKVAEYRYDPFGNTISVSGSLSAANVYRFSSKEIHVNSGLYYYGYRFYDPNLQRWLNRDPIGEQGGINLYNYVANNPINSIDPLGLLGTAVLDTKANTLTITDDDTGKSITVQAFTGGHANPDCSIVSPGPGKETPAPGGACNIVDNPNLRPGTEDWYGLFKQDKRMDDYWDENGKERSGARLHAGDFSHGCATVSKCQPDADKKWKEIRDMINNTKKEKLKFIKGPHWWNP